jgi:hypothetical protein
MMALFFSILGGVYTPNTPIIYGEKEMFTSAAILDQPAQNAICDFDWLILLRKFVRSFP